ncbi:MAG TPA: helix-turn-helix transcriptional regulator [Acidimicrobiales bacterium]
MPSTDLAEPVVGRIGVNVRRLRGDRTQADLATGVACATSTISRIETGTYHRSLDVQMLVRLALALGCSLEELIDGTDMAMTIVRERQRLAAA